MPIDTHKKKTTNYTEDVSGRPGRRHAIFVTDETWARIEAAAAAAGVPVYRWLDRTVSAQARRELGEASKT